MEQIIFDEIEFYGQTLYVCKTCSKCKRDCKIESYCVNADILCKRFLKINKKEIA